MEVGSKIVKAAAPLPARRIEAAVWDADRRVREMVAAAEAEARRILSDAEAERSRLRAEAVEAGRAEGHATAAALLASAAAERDRRLASSAKDVASIAIEVARKVLGRELATTPSAVADLATAALEAARDRRDVTLRVNPVDAPFVRAAGGRLSPVVHRARLEILEDATVEPGGAIVDTEAGRIDARIETQLAALGRALEEACG